MVKWHIVICSFTANFLQYKIILYNLLLTGWGINTVCPTYLIPNDPNKSKGTAQNPHPTALQTDLLGKCCGNWFGLFSVCILSQQNKHLSLTLLLLPPALWNGLNTLAYSIILPTRRCSPYEGGPMPSVGHLPHAVPVATVAPCAVTVQTSCLVRHLQAGDDLAGWYLVGSELLRHELACSCVIEWKIKIEQDLGEIMARIFQDKILTNL